MRVNERDLIDFYPSDTPKPNPMSFVSVMILKKVGHSSQPLSAVNDVKSMRICHLGPSINDVSTARGGGGYQT